MWYFFVMKSSRVATTLVVVAGMTRFSVDFARQPQGLSLRGGEGAACVKESLDKDTLFVLLYSSIIHTSTNV